MGGPSSGSYKPCREWFLYKGTLEDTSQSCLEENSLPSHPLCEKLHHQQPSTSSLHTRIKTGEKTVKDIVNDDIHDNIIIRLNVIRRMLMVAMAGVLSARMELIKVSLDIVQQRSCR